MSTLIEVLKYSGIAVTAIIGIVGVTHDYRPQDTGKLSTAGKFSIFLIIVAAVISGFSAYYSHANQVQESQQRIVEERRKHHELLLLSIQSDPSYQRFKEYYRIWGVLLDNVVNPSPMDAPDLGITGAYAIGGFPDDFVNSLYENVKAVNNLIAKAENQDALVLSAIHKYVDFVEEEAFGEELFDGSTDEYVRSMHAPGSLLEAEKRARKTIEEVVRICSLALRFYPDPLGGVTWSEWVRASIDLHRLKHLWLYTKYENAPKEPLFPLVEYRE